MEQHLDDLDIVCANERDFDRLVQETRICMAIFAAVFVAMSLGLLFTSEKV
jgi:hypothetical protein